MPETRKRRYVYQEPVVEAFLDELRIDNRIQEWQPRQAEDALKLYYFHYLGQTQSAGSQLQNCCTARGFV